MKLLSLLLIAGAALAQYPKPGLNYPGYPGVRSGFYAYASPLTIAASLVGTVNNTDPANFPVWVSLSDARFKTVGNGGYVSNASGFDLGFASDSGCGSLLPWEQVSFDGAAGTWTGYVKIASLSHSVNTRIYICYGNPSISTLQSPTTAAWDANTQAMYHAESVVSITNSATAGFGSGTNNSATSVAGKLGNGFGLSGTTQFVDLGGAGTHVSPVTLEAWVNPSSVAVGAKTIITKGFDNGSSSTEYLLRHSNSISGKVECGNFASAAVHGVTSSTVTLSTSTWYYLVCTFDGTNAWKLYVNGALDTSATDATTVTNTAKWTIGGNQTVGLGNIEFFAGTLDEVGVSNTARNADWIVTRYNNINSIGTFLTLGAQQANTNSPGFIFSGAATQ